MFERLFRFPHALAPHLNGPLAEERRRFLNHRAEEGIGRNSLRVLAYYLLACTRSFRLADRPGEAISYAEVEEQATLWANRSSPAPNMRNMERRRSSRGEFLRHAGAWLRFMGRLQMPTDPPGPCADQLAAFTNFLLFDKGLKPGTVQVRCRTVRRLLDHLAVNNGSLHDVTLSQIDEFFVEQMNDGGYARVTVKGLACDLRSFFACAETKGWRRVGLAAGIKLHFLSSWLLTR